MQSLLLAVSMCPRLMFQLAACFSGLVAGILGLTNQYGFLLYLLTSSLSALTVALLKCQGNIGKYVPQAHSGAQPAPGGTVSGGGKVSTLKGWWALMGLGQENLLGFLLFWIGSYALIHGEQPRVSLRCLCSYRKLWKADRSV